MFTVHASGNAYMLTYVKVHFRKSTKSTSISLVYGQPVSILEPKTVISGLAVPLPPT